MKNLKSLFIIIIFASCQKKDSTPPAAPITTNFSPSSGRPGTAVTITGSNFSSNKSDNIVEFNGVTAVVTSATSTSLIVTVPVASGSGPITITTTSGTATSTSFTYLPDIYLAGEVNSGSTTGIGTYWKNGIQYSVQDSTDNAFIYSMAVNGTDVYMAGSTSAGVTYWKNGVPTLLSGAGGVTSSPIIIAGNDIYIAGSPTALTGGLNVASYWKNAVTVPITNGTTAASAQSIYIDGTDVYVSGSEGYPNLYPAAKYWKNGVATVMDSKTDSVECSSNGIAVVSGNVYAIVSEWNHNSNITSYKLYKNGALTDIAGATLVDRIFVDSANNIYLAGRIGVTATVWKNGVATALTDGTNSAFAHDVKVYNGDVYVAGNEYNGTDKIGKYWKNGVATNVTGKPGNATIWGIVVR